MSSKNAYNSASFVIQFNITAETNDTLISSNCPMIDPANH
jgi:hypothetical protein